MIETTFNNFWWGLRRWHASVRRRGSRWAGLQGHPFNHAVNALVAILMRWSILLVFLQVRSSAHRRIEDGAGRPGNGDRTCHGGHEGA